PYRLDRLMAYVSRALPVDAASGAQETLREIIGGAPGGLLSIGVLGALWAASNGMSSIITALNAVYDVPETRPFWKRKALALGLTLLFSLFILTALILMVFGPKIGETVASWVGLGGLFTVVWNVISVPVVVVLVTIGLTVVYYLAPDAEEKFRWVAPGATPTVLPSASVTAGVGRLAWQVVELGVRETKWVVFGLVFGFGVAIVAAVFLVTGLAVALAAALAPTFGADWRPLLSGGGGGALLAAAALAWSVYRVRHLGLLRHTFASIKETWQWAERRLKSGTT